MLKYQIKLTDDSFKQEELVWSEKYLAPDLSFVSGVTSQSYHLEKFNKLPLTNKLVNNNNSVANLETENVTREGYVIIKDKVYEANSGSVVDYSIESSGTPTSYYYLFLNGKYYYSYKNNGVYSDFVIDNWLSEKLVKEDDDIIKSTVVEDTINVSFNDEGTVKIDTIAWIEDGMVSIDGNSYFFDREEQIDVSTVGGLKYYEDGACLDASAITECSGIEFHPFHSTSDYIHVTKFVLTKHEEINEDFERISFCKRFYYVKYKDYYLPITMEGNEFKCEIPNYVLGTDKEITDAEYYKTESYNVYMVNDESGAIDSEPMSGSSFDDLLTEAAVVIIDNEQFSVDYDIMNANDGNEIAIYLEGDTSNIAIGDRIRIVDTSSTAHTQYVQIISEYDFNSDDTNFVLYNGKKYKVEPNICDRASINGNEYEINYINGKVIGEDCLVLIGEEEVPFKIISDDKLERYGSIISGNSNSAITAQYNIIPYSGVTINNKKYLVGCENEITEGEDEDNNVNYYITLDVSNEYTLMVEDIRGSSMLVCKPDINDKDFTEEFNRMISNTICEDIVDNQSDMILYTKNKIFGDKEITQELAFQNFDRPTSSDDYFNLFDNLEVFSKNGYIHIPLSLNSSQGNNIMQDDIVKNQFYEDVKRRAINPIVDMEKDVYIPKYIYSDDGKYNGSNTIFETIKQIRVNLHFRTRDLDSWKVNDGYNDVSSSGNSDNWFITDINPYRRVIEQQATGVTNLYEYNDNKRIDKINDYNEELNQLYDSSDLVGLLGFTNDDVYYQKSKVAKSFLRFSFYDSPNPQTQSLLATSTVFMDEHKLFKTFVDNSRKNVSDFGLVSEYEHAIDENGVYDTIKGDIASGHTVSKISVMSEYLGNRKDNAAIYLRRTNRYVERFDGVIMDDKHRIGSEFIIDNKIATETSSEGYYLYIFREYSENLHPKPIYMKVEFNHAGIGRIIPFLIPMRWSDKADKNGNKTPISALTLNTQALNENVPSDMELLKKGIKLEDVSAQSYIPLYAVYDFKNKEYAYVFDDRYVTVDKENNILKLNMFELKVRYDEETSEEIQRDITMKKQPTAVIDVNKDQFEEE